MVPTQVWALSISKDIPTAEAIGGGAATYQKSLDYMGYNEGESMIGKHIDFVFIGSCTNGRIEDFRAFASNCKRSKRSRQCDGLVGSRFPSSVEKAIKDEGLLDILEESGFELARARMFRMFGNERRQSPYREIRCEYFQ